MSNYKILLIILKSISDFCNIMSTKTEQLNSLIKIKKIGCNQSIKVYYFYSINKYKLYLTMFIIKISNKYIVKKQKLQQA